MHLLLHRTEKEKSMWSWKHLLFHSAPRPQTPWSRKKSVHGTNSRCYVWICFSNPAFCKYRCKSCKHGRAKCIQNPHTLFLLSLLWAFIWLLLLYHFCSKKKEPHAYCMWPFPFFLFFSRFFNCMCFTIIHKFCRFTFLCCFNKMNRIFRNRLY